MKKYFWGPVAAALIVTTAQSASAFGAGQDANSLPLGDTGTCTAEVNFDGFSQAAEAYVSGLAQLFDSEGTYFFNGVISSTQPITTATLASCFSGATAAEIKNLQQDGAQGTYASDNYIGFSFEYAGKAYEFAVSGTTTTQAIIKNGVPIPPPAPTGPSASQLNEQFMSSRAINLINEQPDLTHLLRGGSGGFDAQITRGNGQFTYASDPSKPTWARLSGKWTNSGATSSEYYFGAVGTHMKMNENFLLGGMLEFDYQSQTSGSTTTDGSGWLVGPYFVAKLPSQPLYFEGRLLYGQTDNTAKPNATQTDKFSTERLLAQVKMSGALNYSKVKLNPFGSLTYVADGHGTYLDGSGATVAAQKVEFGKAELGVDFTVPLDLARGDLNIVGGLSGSWAENSGASGSYEGASANASIGLTYARTPRDMASIRLTYNGDGSANYESLGLTLGYDFQF